MPNPPITIGELTDVPAFGSPIASPWTQEATRRIAHRFATVAERDAKYPAAGAGRGALCAVGATLYVSDGTRWLGGHYGITAGWTPGVALANTGGYATLVGWSTGVVADGVTIDTGGNISLPASTPGELWSFAWKINLSANLSATSFARLLFYPAAGPVIDFDTAPIPTGAFVVASAGLVRIPNGGGTFQTQLFLNEGNARNGTGGRLELHHVGY